MGRRMRIGSLFSGYGGLDMGVQRAIGGDVAWHVEFDPAPSKILEHHYPDVPNYGDIRTVDWDAVEPVDVLTGGFPCQDVSLAGRRAGITAGTRSGLWSEFAHAIDKLRPGLVVIENVRGLLSATADGPMESDPWGVGDGATRPVVNAFGVVLGDLVSLGYDARWCGVRAADAGAPHGRFRVFVVANPRGHEPKSWGGLGNVGSASSSREADREERERVRGTAGDRRTPVAPNTGRVGGGEGDATPERRAEVADRSGVVVERGVDDHGIDWGEYEPAVTNWTALLGRPAPIPRTGDRLNARFVEWMMGLPDGWVTGVDLSWNKQLKALGNGVVPQQAELAIRTLLEAN